MTNNRNTESKSKEKLFSLLCVLVVLMIIVVVGWVLWKFVKLLGVIYLGLFFLASLKSIPFLLWKKDSRVGKTYKESIWEIIGKIKKEPTDEYAKYFFILSGFVAFVLELLTTIFLLCFALDPKNQFFPVNLFGFTAVLFSIAAPIESLRSAFTIEKWIDKKIEPKSIKERAFRLFTAVVINVYIVCLFLILFGIIEKV